MMFVFLSVCLIYSRYFYRQTFVDTGYNRTFIYYGLIRILYSIANQLIHFLLKQPFTSPYLRWHRLLYSNAMLEFCLLATLAKSIFWFLLTLSLLVDGFFLHASGELYFSIAITGMLLSALPIIKVKRQYQEACHQIMKELPSFIQQMALLIKSGSNARQSVDTIYRYCSEKDGIYTLLGHVYFEHERGNDFFQSFSILNEFIHHKSIHHLSLLMGQVKRAGVHQFSTQLIDLAELMMTERQTYIRMMSEQLSTKLLAPMMISMVTILILLIYPIMTQLN